MLEVRPAVGKRGIPAAAANLVKAIVAASATLIAPEPITFSAALSAAVPSLVDAAMSLGRRTEAPLGGQAWEILRAAFACALAEFFSTVPLARRPSGEELSQLIFSLLSRADILAEDAPELIATDHFSSPLRIRVFRDFSQAIPHELALFEPTLGPDEIRRHFERSAFNGIAQVRNADPAKFRIVESALTDSFSQSLELYAAKGRHEQFLIRAFSQHSIFGQELTGITLADLYIKQRCLWRTQESVLAAEEDDLGATDPDARPPKDFGGPRSRKANIVYRLSLGDLHKTLQDWLQERNAHDQVRVVAGGPGSGKSTFAKAFGIETLDRGDYDVLFIPLQELDSTGTFETRCANLFRNRSELGFDRVDSPLNWLAKSEADGTPPRKPLLLLCDGLDELAPPDSKEAANVTTDFIQTLSQWLAHRNSSGCFVKAIVLGRTIAADEAFRKLSIDSPALLQVAGLLPLTQNAEWKTANSQNLVDDLTQKATDDQRVDYWKLWCKANGVAESDAPVALRPNDGAGSAVVELTTEPLLLYLLMWTGFLGERWDEVANNRNVVYLELFKRIYQRDWGKGHNATQPNRQSGGHIRLTDVKEDDFFSLQEVLGLASWATGGRTVSASAFATILDIYLTEEQKDDLDGPLTSSLKSVALQSYTRGADNGEDGYEFVHKTLGEYLIARALVSTMQRAMDMMKERTTDNRCKAAALFVTGICSIGFLSQEISHFFRDEVRMRFPGWKLARTPLEEKVLPIVNWSLRNKLPAHEATDEARKLPFVLVARNATRAMDVLWSFAQHLAVQAYPAFAFQAAAETGGWKAGPISVHWPAVTSFSTLFSELSDRTHVAETKRLAAFSFVDLSDQAVTEQDYGSILFDAPAPKRHVMPRIWIPTTFIGSNFNGGQFLGSLLREAVFDYCSIARADFTEAELDRASFISASARRAEFEFASLRGANFSEADLSGCLFYGARLSGTFFSGATLRGARFTHRRSPNVKYVRRYVRHSAMADCDFSGTDLRHTHFGEYNILKCNFRQSNLSDTVFAFSTIDDQCTFDEANMLGATFRENQLSTMQLSAQQRKQIKILTEAQLLKMARPHKPSHLVIAEDD